MRITSLFALVLLLAPLCHDNARAEEAKDVAIVLKSKGRVNVSRPQKKIVIPAKRGTRLSSGNLVRTGDQSLAALVFTDDKSLLKIRSNSKVVIKGKREEQSIVKTIFMELGQIWAKVTRSEVAFQVKTPSGVAAVKGTGFYCFLDEFGRMFIICLEGLVELSNEHGTVLVGAGQTGIAAKDQPPTLRQSDPEEIPTWGTSQDEGGKIKIEFENGLGEKKNLNIGTE